MQGLGAGGLFSLALAIIGDIVPPRERAKYQGYFLAVFGTSSVLGPVVGGFFAGADSILGITGWRWVFLVNVPIGIAALALVSKTLHLRHQRLDHRIDWTGAALLSVALVPLLLVAEQGREWGWGSTNAIVCYAIGVVAGVLFFWQEGRMGDEAILPLSLFRNRTVAVSSAASILIGIAMFGGLASLPLYLQIVKGASPTEAGLLLVPMTLGIMSGSIISGQVISRTGRYRWFPIVGVGLLMVSLFVFHYVEFDTPLWQTMIVMVFFGLGLGFNFQPLTLAVQNAVPPQQIGVATSTATFTRQIGGTIGTAVFLTILFSLVPEKIAGAMRAVAPTPEFQEALRDPANAEFARQMAQSQASGEGSAAASSGVLQDRLVPQHARRAAGQAVPHGLLGGHGPRVPRRLGRHGPRLHHHVVPARGRASARARPTRSATTPTPEPLPPTDPDCARTQGAASSSPDGAAPARHGSEQAAGKPQSPLAHGDEGGHQPGERRDAQQRQRRPEMR